MNKQAPQLDTGPQLQPGDERRRSQRVIIRIPVTLEMVASGKKVTIRATTASVNDHGGAMLVCTKNLPVDALFDLINDRTQQKQVCRVIRAPVDNQGGYLLPVDSRNPLRVSRHISFPPPGWKGVEN